MVKNILQGRCWRTSGTGGGLRAKGTAGTFAFGKGSYEVFPPSGRGSMVENVFNFAPFEDFKIFYYFHPPQTVINRVEQSEPVITVFPFRNEL